MKYRIANIGWMLLLSFSSLATAANPLTTETILNRIVDSSTPILGMHDTLGGVQSHGFDFITTTCGSSPKLLSMDFGFSTHPNDSIRLRKNILFKAPIAVKKGALFTLSWHQCNPTIDEPCTFRDGVQKKLAPDEWDELLNDGSELNLRWKNQVNRLAGVLKEFQSKGIVVLLRPYHESNIPGFWWANKDPKKSIYLWKMLHRYLTKEHKLDNIIWVWSVSFHPKYWKGMPQFYPGGDFVDILGLDIYPPTKAGIPAFGETWNDLKILAPNKPIALSEVSRLPSQSEIKKHKWAYIVPWGQTMLQRDNTLATICRIYSQ